MYDMLRGRPAVNAPVSVTFSELFKIRRLYVGDKIDILKSHFVAPLEFIEVPQIFGLLPLCFGTTS